MGRSGSTLLCNLLTVPPGHLIFIEPGFHAHPYRQLLAPQLSAFNLPDLKTLEEKYQVGLHTADQRLDACLGEHLRTTKWGMKEVLCSDHEQVIQTFQPTNIIVCVRDIFQVALSFFDKHRQQANETRFPHEWVETYCKREASGLLQLYQNLQREDRPLHLVKYEDMALDPTCLPDLGKALDWPITGHPGMFLESFGREFEFERHGQILSPPLPASKRDLSAGDIQAARRIEADCCAYQSFFGYLDP